MKGLMANRDTMMKVCKLYYIEDKTQSEIARLVGISRPQVSRLLTKAKNEGVVRIEIDSGKVENLEEISIEMKERFGLKNVIVADEAADGGTIASIAVSAAKFLSDYVKNGQLVGISWGRTLYETVERVVFNGELPNTTFIPLIGGVGQLRHEYQMNSIVEKIANSFHSNRYYLFAPAFIENAKTLNMMLEDSSIRFMSEMWKRLDLAIVGIGEPISLSNAFKNIYDKEFLANLMKHAAVGDIAARFFNADGTPCVSGNENILGISLDQLKEVPEVIGIAGGKEKAQAIHASIKAGYINSIVTDRSTALQILRMQR
ncbi:sugar-binding transcriptional regulator [uncultured Mesotoga sp.]|uniref:sugar-binding transcriptional regulator n=1 Tax=uncultured Mesotoga sp. TaxID=1184400 RepID=UPI00259A0EB9|nr:sugar-binding transcriptional regulator [uncultured Mesotoga sp.]